MTQLLEERIKLLEEQNALLKKIIDVQDSLIAELKKNSPLPFVSIPSVWTTPCQHEYPFPWHATVPPHCKKCGQQAPSFTITSSDIIDKC